MEPFAKTFNGFRKILHLGSLADLNASLLEIKYKNRDRFFEKHYNAKDPSAKSKKLEAFKKITNQVKRDLFTLKKATLRKIFGKTQSHWSKPC